MNVLLILYIGGIFGYWFGYEVRGNEIRKADLKILKETKHES